MFEGGVLSLICGSISVSKMHDIFSCYIDDYVKLMVLGETFLVVCIHFEKFANL